MYALVTGASSGMGLQYATMLARDYHYDILLVSNQEQQLREVAANLHQQYGVETSYLYMNLAEADAAERIFAYTEEHHLEVEVLVNNAGFLFFEEMIDVPVAKIQTMLMLHIVTATTLCRLFAPQMTNRRRGYILNMSSMTAWMSMPGIQVYNATKAYLLNFSRAFWYEMQRYGVHVLAVTPGSIDTPLLPFPPVFARLLRVTRITMPPERLVARALRVLFRSRRKRCMPGAWNYIIVPIINHLPDWVVFTAMRLLPQFHKINNNQ